MHEGIAYHERVLLVCSSASLERTGVVHELRKALMREAAQGSPEILVPLALEGGLFTAWKPKEEGLKEDLLSRVVADFSGWTDAASFDAAFEKLMRRH